MRRAGIALADARLAARYGRGAPRRHERIHVRPASCSTMRPLGDATGVREGDWDRDALPLDGYWKTTMCRAHWEDGLPWADTGIYDVMMERIDRDGQADGCRTLDDVVRRYEKLDAVFDQIRREGRLRSASEVRPHPFRERGGVLFHIGRDGPVFGRRGGHRFAIALVLGLEVIPAQVGVVHPDAVPEMVSYRTAP